MLHINTVHEILSTAQPVDLRCWKINGEILHYKNCVAIGRKNGLYTLKLLTSNLIRTLPEVLIFELNDQQVYL